MYKNRKIRILIEAAGTATCISVLKGLRHQNPYPYETYVVDMNKDAAGQYFADHFFTVPSSREPDYAKSILDLCTKNQIDLFVPIMDYGFRTLSKLKEQFLASDTHPLIADYENISICMDKLRTYDFFVQAGIPTPKTFATADLVSQEYLPVIIKPRTGGVASQNVFTANTPEELQYHSRSSNYIVQKKINGREFTADCLASLDGQSYIECVIRERISTKGGLSTHCRFIDSESAKRIEPYIKEISGKLRIPGAYNIQGFMTNTGEIFFIEVNPRFAGTHTFTIRAGMNSIVYILNMLVNKSTPESIKSDIRLDKKLEMVRYWNEIFIENETASTWTRPLLKQP